MANEIKFDFKEIMASEKEATIKLLPGTKTGKKMKAGIGVSKLRPSEDKSGSTITFVATILDKILVSNTVAAKNFLDGVYGEYTTGGTTYCFTCGEDCINYKGKALTGPDALIPLVCFYLSEPDPYKVDSSELCSVFAKIRDNYARTGAATAADVALFCDSFYYTAMSHVSEDSDFKVVENHIGVGRLADAIKDYSKEQYDEVVKPIPMFSGINMPSLTGLPDYAEEAKVSGDICNFDDVKAGKFRLNIDWSDEANMYVPSLSELDDFVPSAKFYSQLRKLHYRLSRVVARMDAGFTGKDAIKDDYVNYMIVGRPGTGKTTMLYALGAALGLPVSTITISNNTEEDTFEGMNKIVNGGFHLVDTDFLKRYEEGGIAACEELNLANPAVTSGAMGQAIEKPFILKKDGHINLTRHPLFICVGTMNVNTFGSKGVNQALDSRLKQTYVLEDPDDDVFIQILQTRTGCSEALAKWVYEAYSRILNMLMSKEYNSEDLCLNITLRGCIGAIENIIEGSSPKEALEDTFYGKIYVNDPAIADRIKEEVIDSLKDFRGSIC